MDRFRIASNDTAPILVFDEGDIQWMSAARRPQDGRLDIVCCHGLDGCQESPLVRIRSEVGIHEYAVTTFARPFLQRQGDQVAEATLGHRVLVREQSVVGFQLQLPGARAGVADDCRTQAPGITGGNAGCKEHPRVRTLACGPLAELNCAFGIHLVAHCDDGGQAVVLDVVTFSVGGSYSKFSNN